MAVLTFAQDTLEIALAAAKKTRSAPAKLWEDAATVLLAGGSDHTGGFAFVVTVNDVPFEVIDGACAGCTDSPCLHTATVWLHQKIERLELEAQQAAELSGEESFPEPEMPSEELAPMAPPMPELPQMTLTIPDTLTLHHTGAAMSDAPYSANVFVDDPDGWSYQITIRKQSSQELVNGMEQLKVHLTKKGWTSGRKGTEPGGGEPPPPPTQDTSGPPTMTTKSFSCGNLVPTFHEGKWKWRIFSDDTLPETSSPRKYGVPIYPEVMTEYGLDPNADPPQAKKLTGWTAVYSLKPDGKTEKVIRLVKG